MNYARVMKDSGEVINIADFVSPEPLNSEQLTIDNTAGGKPLTADKYTTAHRASIQVETAPIRMTLSGTAPTATYGKLYEPGDEIILESHKEITNFRAIRTTEVSGILNIEYSV
jgi:hypothetical protein